MPSERYSLAVSSIGCCPGHLPHRDMERDGDLAHQEGLVVGLGVLVQELQQEGFHLEPDGIHPLDAVAILGRVQAELPDGFVALPSWPRSPSEAGPR